MKIVKAYRPYQHSAWSIKKAEDGARAYWPFAHRLACSDTFSGMWAVPKSVKEIQFVFTKTPNESSYLIRWNRKGEFEGYRAKSLPVIDCENADKRTVVNFYQNAKSRLRAALRDGYKYVHVEY